MSFVTLKNVNKQYKKGVDVISDVSLEIGAGEFLGIRKNHRWTDIY